MQGIVTTAASGDAAEAAELAGRCGLRCEARAGRTLQQVLEGAAGAPVLVLAARRADLYEGGKAFRATAGMAFLRVLRARKGEPEPLLTHVQPGDQVLDATLGLGGDALVAAAAGARVTGVEASGLLAAFTQAALRRLPGHGREPGRSVEVRNADHREFLRAQQAGSFDVVLLDPMFRRAGDAGPLFELLRAHADRAPLGPATLREAQRVARRGVLVKDAAPGDELRRLGLAPQLSRRSATICFGWLPSTSSSQAPPAP
ncbi:MAG TPA: class I SAM-dependent methyltransferase [Myxococcales bacterium]|nr:class I SAM-dependent methyltransferase [Myxococcales bacterium]